MISKQLRIRASQFPGVTRGKLLNHELIKVSVKTDNSLKSSKYAVIVSNKVSKSAVQRNLLRRQLYSAIRENTGINKHPAAYICITVKKIPNTYSELIGALKELLWEK